MTLGEIFELWLAIMATGIFLALLWAYFGR